MCRMQFINMYGFIICDFLSQEGFVNRIKKANALESEMFVPGLVVVVDILQVYRAGWPLP